MPQGLVGTNFPSFHVQTECCPADLRSGSKLAEEHKQWSPEKTVQKFSETKRRSAYLFQIHINLLYYVHTAVTNHF